MPLDMPFARRPLNPLATPSREESLAALKKKLEELDAQRLDMAVNREANLKAADRGFMMNGVGSPAYDLVSKEQQIMGDIGKTRDALAGGSGELQYRAGSNRVLDDGVDRSLSPNDANMPASIKALNASTSNIAAGAGQGALEYQKYKTALAESEAAERAAKAREHQAKAVIDPSSDFLDRQAEGTFGRSEKAQDFEQGLTYRGKQKEQDLDFGGREQAQELEGKQNEYFSRAAESERERQDRNMRQTLESRYIDPAKIRVEGAANVQAIKSDADKFKAAQAAAAKVGGDAVQAGLANGLTPPDPSSPTYKDEWLMYETAVRRLAQAGQSAVIGQQPRNGDRRQGKDGVQVYDAAKKTWFYEA